MYYGQLLTTLAKYPDELDVNSKFEVPYWVMHWPLLLHGLAPQILPYVYLIKMVFFQKNTPH